MQEPNMSGAGAVAPTSGRGSSSDGEPTIAAAVITVGGRVLLIQRTVAEDTLLWTLPSGGVEPGESEEQAAVREVREETGLEVTAVRVLGRRVHPATGRLMVYVACEVLAGQASAAAPEEVAEIAWCGRSGVAKLVPGGLYGPVQEYLEPLLAA